MSPAQHVTLVRDVLGPLAAMHAPTTIASITKEHCANQLETPSSSLTSSSSSENQFEETGIKFWEDLSASERAMIGKHSPSPSSSPQTENHSLLTESTDRAALAASMCLALLQPLVQRPVTIITQAVLPYSNAELPWFIENTSRVVFIVAGQGASSAQSPQRRPGRSMRMLRRQISSLLRRRDIPDEEGSVDPETALNRAVSDAVALRNLLAHVVEDAGVLSTYSREKLLGACLLRCVILSPSVHNSATMTHFTEDLVRAMGTPAGMQTIEGTTSTGTAAYLNSSATAMDSSQEAFSHHAAEEVPVVVAGGEESTVTRVEAPFVPGSNGTALPKKEPWLDFAATGEPEIVVPPSMELAASAASEIQTKDLLRLAYAAVRMRRPLLGAFALSAARHAAVAVDKLTWQVHVSEALKVATASEHNAEHPQEMIAPWLEILKWLADSRWRRLPPGSHTVALSEFLDGLSRRTQIIGVLTPEELVDPNLKERRNTLSAVASAAAGKIRQIGQSSGNQGERSHNAMPAGHAESGEREDHPGGSSESDSNTSSMTQQPHIATYYSHQPSPSPRGVPATISEIEYPLPPPEEDPTIGKKLASGFRSIGKSVTQAGKSVSQAGSKLINKRPVGGNVSPRTSPSSSSSAASAVGGYDVAGGGMTQRPLPSNRQLEAIEPERDQLVREGLAAFAVASYIRSVMDPRLTRRTASGAAQEPPSSPERVQPTHTRGDSRLTGSRQQEELEFSDFDTVLAAREAIDYLGQLAEKPLLKIHRNLYAPFLDRMPQLLTSSTGVGTFVMEVTRLLLPGGTGEVVLAVLFGT